MNQGQPIPTPGSYPPKLAGEDVHQTVYGEKETIPTPRCNAWRRAIGQWAVVYFEDACTLERELVEKERELSCWRYAVEFWPNDNGYRATKLLNETSSGKCEIIQSLQSERDKLQQENEQIGQMMVNAQKAALVVMEERDQLRKALEILKTKCTCGYWGEVKEHLGGCVAKVAQEALNLAKSTTK